MASSKKILCLLAVIFIIIPSFVYAINVPGLPLVPCGTSTTALCTQCDLYQLLKNILDFVTIGLMPPLATLFFVMGGFLILVGGANANWVALGKTIFTNTFYGVMIMLAAWMITNTLIQSVGANYDNADSWWEFSCTPYESSGGGGTPPADTSGGGADSELCNDPEQLASQYGVPYPAKNSPELDDLILCVNAKLSLYIDQNQIYTYEKTNDLCNYTRGEPVCGTCAHSVHSCHYGGETGSAGSMAVDFNAAYSGDEWALFEMLSDPDLQAECNFGFINFENNHTHVSTMSCDNN